MKRIFKIVGKLLGGLVLLIIIYGAAVWGYYKYKFYRILNADKESIISHESRQLSNWTEFMKTPLEERVEVYIDELVDENLLMTGYNAKELDLSENSTNGDMKKFETFFKAYDIALYSLPPNIRVTLDQKLTAIFLVKNLGVTGFTQVVLDNRNEVASHVFIDVDRAYKPINEWYWMVENRGFTKGCNPTVNINMTNPDIDPIVSTMIFVILHELSHVLSVNTDIHAPYFDKNKFGQYSWNPISWKYDDKQYVPRQTFTKTLLDLKLNGSKDGKVKCEKLPSFYGELKGSDFVNLYAITSPIEDFAESLSHYIFTKQLGHTFEVTIDDGNTVTSVPPCWDHSRCKAKQVYIENYLGIDD